MIFLNPTVGAMAALACPRGPCSGFPGWDQPPRKYEQQSGIIRIFWLRVMILIAFGGCFLLGKNR
ncbi:hypothetical protein J2S53_000732 [Actinopolyspora lacussalsi]|nr:hypothetical protein [Actinopolyspora lacussalsi]